MEAYTDNGELKNGPKGDTVIEEAKRRADSAWLFDQENREEGVKDQRFRALDQWPEAVRAEREAANRPCLTLDHLQQMINQVTNDIRQAKVELKAVPADRKTEPARGELVTSLMRDIQYKSHASYVYAMAADGAVGCGIGHLRVKQIYSNEKSFNQELRIEHIPYPFAVYWDPAAVLPDRSDAEWCLIVEFMPRLTFKRKYPHAKPVDIEVSRDNQGGLSWSTGDGVLIAEYYRKVYRKATIAAFENGDVLDVTGMSDKQKSFLPGIVAERETEICEIKHSLLSGVEELEPTTGVPGKYIPVIAMTGQEIHLERKRVRLSLIRAARDGQQLYNYWRSAAAEVIALAPKAKWLVTAKQIQNRQHEWDQAHASSKAYLTYTPDTKAEGLAPKRLDPPEAPAAIWQEAALVIDDMKAATGIYDASLGKQGNETSGVAIQNRQREGDVSTFHFSDNMMRSLEHLGNVMLNLIPLVYDTEREVQIMDEDENQEFAQINTSVMQVDGTHAMLNDLSEGKFALRASIGPSYTTQRMEAAAGMLEYVKNDPDAMPFVRDLFVGEQDWPGADKMAERLKRSIPAEVLGPDEQPKQETLDPAVQAAQQQQQQAQELLLREQQAKVEHIEAETGKVRADTEKSEVEAHARALEAKLAVHTAQNPPEAAEAKPRAQSSQGASSGAEGAAGTLIADGLRSSVTEGLTGIGGELVQAITASNQELAQAIAQQGQDMTQAVAVQGQQMAQAVAQVGQQMAEAVVATQDDGSTGRAVEEMGRQMALAESLRPAPDNSGQADIARALETVAQGMEKIGSLGEAMIEAARTSAKPKRFEVDRDRYGNMTGGRSKVEED